jgi:hypothetical protein
MDCLTGEQRPGTAVSAVGHRDAIYCGAPPGKADPAPSPARCRIRPSGWRRAAPSKTCRNHHEHETRNPMDHDALTGFSKVSLDRLKLAADVILSEADAIPDSLEVEVVLFRERVERALLLPGKPTETGG